MTRDRDHLVDRILIVGTILMCAAAAIVAALFAILVAALPAAALKGIFFLALVILAATLLSVRLRDRLVEEEKDETRWFTALVFFTQFFLALAWAALIAAIVVMIRTT
ncbi:MAG: hypothetical protein R6V07_15830 [Armatimonadota bacterium]